MDGEARYSPDASWWWSGERWLPAVSPDGRWRWDGSRWAPRNARAPLPRYLLAAGGAWLVVIGAWLPVTNALAGSNSSLTVTVGAAMAAAALVCTLALGGLVGRERSWREVAATAAIGTCALLTWYVATMVGQPDAAGSEQAAGAGAVIFAVPAFVAIGSLLAAGASIGRWRRRKA